MTSKTIISNHLLHKAFLNSKIIAYVALTLFLLPFLIALVVEPFRYQLDDSFFFTWLIIVLVVLFGLLLSREIWSGRLAQSDLIKQQSSCVQEELGRHEEWLQQKGNDRTLTLRDVRYARKRCEVLVSWGEKDLSKQQEN